MRAWMIAFSLGIGLAGLAPALPARGVLPLFLVLPVLALRWPRLVLAGAFSLGLWWGLSWGLAALADLLPHDLEGRDFWVEGRVADLPQRGELSQRFAFQVERWCLAEAQADCRWERNPRLRRLVLLSHYGAEEIRPAQRWRLKLRLKRPHGFANPGGFDYEAWLFQQRFSAAGYVREDPDNRLLATGAGRPGFQRLRFAFRQRLERLAAGEGPALRHTALIKALTVGDRYSIGNDQWELFSATGTNHLVVISGLHVGLVALLGYQLAAWLARRRAALLLISPSHRLGAAAAVLAGFFYCGLAGFSLPAQRAFLMLLALMLGRLLARQTDPLNGLCLALGVMLARDPMAPQNTGFWLSFGAVSVLLLHAGGPRPRTGGAEVRGQGPLLQGVRCLALLRVQLGLFIGLLPLMLIFFRQASLLAPLVNLLAIPLVGLLVVPLCLLGLALLWFWPWAAGLAFLAADLLLRLFQGFLEAAVELAPFAVLPLPALPVWALALLLAATGLLLSRLRPALRLLALPGFLPLLLPGGAAPPEGGFRLHILDVGQGLAVVVETARHRLIYDTGPAYSPRFDAGSGVLLPFLSARNLRRIDRVIVSHGDNDHAGGLPALARRLPAARYFAAEPGELPESLDAEACRRGQHWHWDGVDFDMLHPPPGQGGGNDGSCVLRIRAGGGTVLLAGDIEGGAERRLLRGGGDLRAEVLIAPHHGSRTSSMPAFVYAVGPDWVVFASGYLNRFGHPAPDVRARYRRIGARELITAHTGAIRFDFPAEGPLPPPVLWREERRRWWSSTAAD